VDRYRDRARLTADRTPTNQRNNNPHQVGIPVQAPALEQIRALAAVPLQHAPQPDGHQRGIAIDEAGGAAQQLEVVRKVVLAVVRQVLIDGAREEQDDDDGGGDPHGAVQVRVALEHVEEVGSRVDGRRAAAQDLGCVDVEGLRVEGQRPQEVLAPAVAGRCRRPRQEGRVGVGAVWLDLGAAGVGLRVKVCGYLLEGGKAGNGGWGAYSTCGTRGPLGGRCGLGRPVRGRVGCWVAHGIAGSRAIAYLLVDVDDNIVAAVRHAGRVWAWAWLYWRGCVCWSSVSSCGQIALDVARRPIHSEQASLLIGCPPARQLHRPWLDMSSA
jgi:hypothetical protein